MAVIYFAMVLIVIRFFTPAIIFGEGLCAFLCSYLLLNIMGLLEEKKQRTRTGKFSANCMAEKNCNTYGIIINSPFLLYVSFNILQDI